jgi:DNA-binding transcriptional ArsR family regulator
MDSKDRLLFWLLAGTKGGPTRVRLLKVLDRKPMNLRRLSMELEMDYKSIKAHIELLLKNGVLDSQGSYGAIYFISPQWEESRYLKEMLGGSNGKRKKG